MKTGPVVRIFSKSGRSAVLDLLLAAPKSRLGINELARRAKVPVATAWRAVQDLENLGLLRTDRVANLVLVQLNDRSPAVKAIASLEMPDPHRMAFDAFAQRLRKELPGVQVTLFGSVSRCEHSPSSDVDAMVSFRETGLTRSQVQDACARVSNEILDTYGIVVSSLITSSPVVIP